VSATRPHVRLDEIDCKIVRILLENGNTSKAELARSVGLTPTAVFERMRKLEDRGVITGYSVRLDPRVLGLDILAYVFVSEIKPVKKRRTGPRLAQLPSVEEVHRVAGRDCFLLKVRATNTDSLTRILDDIGRIDSVGAVETTIVLETYLEKHTDLPPENDR
jgi:Lrp/AsnC family leucine-responsive transcriptional regulator